MTNNKLTDRRVEQYAEKQFSPDGVEPFIPMGDEVVMMARELQEYRKAQSEPVGAPDAWLWKKKTGYITAGVNRPMYEPLHSAAIPLYACPPLPQPEAESGFAGMVEDYETKLEELRTELQEYRKAPELKLSNLLNKFYERYPLEEFTSDSERAAALGYFLAGCELQCFGEFIKYEDLCGDE